MRPLTPRARYGLALAAVAATVIAATPAHAASKTWSDSAGDVWKMDGQTGEVTAAPEQTNGDVISTTVRYASRAIFIKQQFVELDTVGDALFQASAIRTNEGVRRELYVGADSMDWATPYAQLFRPRGEPVGCAVQPRFDFEANTITVRVPRTCLSSPRWVQLQVGAASFVEDAETFTIYFDDAHTETPDRTTWSPRIHRD